MKTLLTLCLAVLGSISFAAGNVELTSAEKKLLELQKMNTKIFLQECS